MEDFVCKKCGECCKNQGIVMIYPEDAVNIAGYLNISTKKFLKEYCHERILQSDTIRLKIYYMEIGQKCCFLDDDNLCSINGVKPCLLYTSKRKGDVGIMELIFFYVNQSRTKFIEKQGFNFSSRYKFSVEYDKGTYILKGFECENPLPQNFFDETGCIRCV